MSLPGRWRRRAIVVGVILVVLAALVAWTPLDEVLVAAAVGRAAGADVSIGELDWSWSGRLRAFELTAALPTASEPFFTTAEAAIDVAGFPPRIAGVALDRPRLVATEATDGTFDLLTLRRESSGDSGAPPPLTVVGGVVELQGDGPLSRRLREFLAPDVAATLAIARLDVAPGSDGTAQITGRLGLCGVLPLDLEAVIAAGALVGGSLRVDPREAIDLGALRPHLAAPIAKWLAENRLSGRVSGEARLVGAAGALLPAVELDLADIAMVPQVFPAVLERLGGRVALRDGALVIDGLNGVCGDGSIAIHGRVDDLAGAAATRVVARFDRATLDDAMRAACRTDPVGKMMLEAFEPAGQWSCTATVVAGRDREFDLELDIGVEGMSGCFRGFLDEEGRRHGFPMRFERVRGRVVATPRHSWFQDIVGFTLAGGRAEASGDILGATVTGDVESEALTIDDELLAAAESEVGPAIPQLVRDLGVTGTFATLANYSLDAAGKFTLTLAVTPRAITLRPKVFPFAVALDSGVVRVDDDGVHVESLRGTAGGGTVQIDGTVALADDPPFQVRVQARNVAWSDELLEACRAAGGDALATRLAALELAGRFDVLVVIDHAASGAPLEVAITLQPRSAAATIAAPLRVTGVSGTLELSARGDAPFTWAVGADGLSGRLGAGAISVLPPAEAGGPLRVEAAGIAIDAALQTALAPRAPGIAELLAEHQVEGAFRAAAELALDGAEGGGPRLLWLDLAPDRALDGPLSFPPQIAAAPPWLPLPLQWRSGVMHVELPSGRVTFGRLEGRLGDARAIVGGGSFAPTQDGLLARLDVDLDGLSFSEFLELVLGDARRATLNDYGPIGRTRAVISELTFELGDDGDALQRLSARGSLDARGWALYTAGALRELTGRLEIESLDYERRSGTVDDVRVQGALSGVTLQIGAERFSSLDAEVLLQRGRLSIPWIAADFAGGRLPREKNHFAVELAGKMPFDGRLELEAADISRLLGDDVASMKSLVGRVDAAIGLRGGAAALLRSGEVTDLEAAGTVRIADAKLWSIPLFDKLYSLAIQRLINLDPAAPADPPRWTRGAFDFALQGIYVRLSKVELEGEPLILRGKGTLGPERLRIDFYPEVRSGVGFLRDLPLIGWAADLVLSLLERQVAAFVFVGPYASPEVVWDPVALPGDDLDIALERPRTSPRRSGLPAERF